MLSLFLCRYGSYRSMSENKLSKSLPTLHRIQIIQIESHSGFCFCFNYYPEGIEY